MSTCLEDICLFGLLCVYCDCQFMCVLFPFWFWEWDLGVDCICSWSVPFFFLRKSIWAWWSFFRLAHQSNLLDIFCAIVSVLLVRMSAHLVLSQRTSDSCNVNLPKDKVNFRILIHPRICFEICFPQLPITGYKCIFGYFGTKTFNFLGEKPHFIIKPYRYRKSFLKILSPLTMPQQATMCLCMCTFIIHMWVACWGTRGGVGVGAGR